MMSPAEEDRLILELHFWRFFALAVVVVLTAASIAVPWHASIAAGRMAPDQPSLVASQALDAAPIAQHIANGEAP